MQENDNDEPENLNWISKQMRITEVKTYGRVNELKVLVRLKSYLELG